jgi:hypothetical protein
MKKTYYFKSALIIMLVCFNSIASASDIYLSNSGLDTNDGSLGSPVKTLSKALSIAVTGDVIHVMNFIDITAEPSKAGARGDIALAGTSTYITGGVTYNTWNVNGTLGIIPLSKPLTIIGVDKATCGFDGKNATCIIRQDGTTTANLITYQNLTFKNGKSADASGGGGMYIRSAKASFTNCEFTGNASGGTGNVNPGGAVTIITSIVTFNSTRFASNIAKSGCGIYAQSGTITLDGCTIENNDASGVASSVGGGIYASIVSGGAALNMDVKNTVFKSNKVVSNGGALYYTDAAAFASNLKFTNVAFISNQVSTNYGGGAYIDNKTASSTLNLSFINSTFYDNLVGGTSGGALFINSALTGSFINLINSTLTGNKVTGTTGSAGAGIRMLSASLNSTRRIYNCIIENNVGTTEDMSILNNYTDFAIQGDSYTAGTSLIIDKSFIARSTNTNFTTQFGTANTVNYAVVTSGSINNSFKAQFGTFDATNNFLPLLATSPAIGYGLSTYLSSLTPSITTDQRGYTRPFTGGICDAGAYEFNGLTTTLDNLVLPFSVYSSGLSIYISGSDIEGKNAKVYSINGMLRKSVILSSNSVELPLDKGFYIVKIDTRALKVLVK